MCLVVHSCARLQGLHVSFAGCICFGSPVLCGISYPFESGRAAIRLVSYCSSLIESCGCGGYVSWFKFEGCF